MDSSSSASTAAETFGPVRIHRAVTFDLAAFDRLKAWQRHLSASQGRPLTNSEELREMILAHPAP